LQKIDLQRLSADRNMTVVFITPSIIRSGVPHDRSGG